MPKNTLIALMAALGGSILCGVATLLLAFLLLHGLYINPEDSRWLSLVVGLILCFVMPFFVCIGFLLPLAAIEKAKIGQFTRKALLIRYTPLIAFPAGFLFLLFCYNFRNDDRCFIITLLLTVTGISFSALWFFLYRLKYKS